jgi:methyl-accepting chemotaxis protein
VTVDEALETLGKLAYSPEGKTLLENIKRSRVAYVTSFSRVVKLLAEEKRDEAPGMMSGETLPALDALQQHITAMVNLKRRLVDEDSAETRQNVESARNLIIGLGLAALLIGIGFSYVITRSITRP